MVADAPVVSPEHTPDLCKSRGFHGPFVNIDRYEAVPGWAGYGDCAICGSTCRTDSAPTPIIENLPEA